MPRSGALQAASEDASPRRNSDAVSARHDHLGNARPEGTCDTRLENV